MRSEKRNSPWLRNAACLIVAGCVLFSVAYLGSIGTLADGGLSEVEFVYRANAVASHVTVPQCLLAAVFAWLLAKTGKLPAKGDLPIVLLAIACSLMTVLGCSIAQLETVTFFFGRPIRIVAFVFVWISLAAMLFTLLKALFDKVLDAAKESGHKGSSEPFHAIDYGYRRLFKFVPLIFLVAWLPYVILTLPGTMSYDMTWMIQQFQGIKPLTTHHPLIATLLYGAVFSLGEMIGGGNADIGVLAITIVQTAAWVSVCSFEVRVMRMARLPFWLVACGIAFFALVPAFGTYCQYGVKDSLFAACFALYASLFIVYVSNPRAFISTRGLMVALALSAFATGVLRNNGFYVVLLSLPFLALLHEGWRAKCAALTPLAIVVVLIPASNVCLQFALGASSGSVAEALSIPLQQTARYALVHPDDIEDWEYEAINGVIDYENAADNYRWNVSDPVKGTFKNGDLGAYFSAWLAQGLRHPGSYLDATLTQTYGYWYPELGTSAYTPEGYCYETSYAASSDWGGSDAESFGWTQWFPTAASRLGDNTIGFFRCVPFIGYLANDGLYTWALLIEWALLAYACKRGGKARYALILVPGFVLLLTCLASPLCGSVRYFLGIIATFPITISATYGFVVRRQRK